MNARVFIFLILMSFIFVSCSDENAIKKEIEDANYCNERSDCMVLRAKCPFGCQVAVNKDDVNEIKGLIDSYDEDCTYDCVMLMDHVCHENKCVLIYDSSDYPDGSLACDSDSDCWTPMGYLIRSSCPFASKCIDNQCRVVCPLFNHAAGPDVNQSYHASCDEDSDCVCDMLYGSEEYETCGCVDNQCMAVVK